MVDEKTKAVEQLPDLPIAQQLQYFIF